MRKQRREPLTGLAATIVQRWPHVPDDDARETATEWVVAWMDPAEIMEWMDAGFLWHQAPRVILLRKLGMTPELMRKTVDGTTVFELLQVHGLSPREVANRLGLRR
ncbi:hypothetical protein [Pseudonocardia sp. TRM90224]|uniref:hypothetical protein n=1 Tax=Pseudonocardia sp. TRM90224 TaxID=2812678 RepID=UPI001E46186C|nr:hypothetical protein [Pseudonocardia sp. TRM90224]